MQTGSITSSEFILTPLNDGVYSINIQFSSEELKNVSGRTFYFYKKEQSEEGRILDVFTKNGQCHPSPINRLFQKRDVEEASFAAAALKSYTEHCPVIAVFDFKDPDTSYLPTQRECSIAKCEEVVSNFLKNDNTGSGIKKAARALHALFKEEMPLDYLLCEGSLKGDLLKLGGFSDREIEFLNSKQGASHFCQCAEFFMNGFKLGYSVCNDTTEFSGSKYIKPISGRFTAFKPQSISTVFYPVQYKEMYSPQGGYAQSLQPIYSVEGDYEESMQITTLHVWERKPS